MNRGFKAACVQNCAGPDVDANLEEVDRLIRQSADAGAELVCTPEFFSCLDVGDVGLETAPAAEHAHPVLAHCRALAGELGVFLLLGSIAVVEGANRPRNRSILIDPGGELVARYDKLHMFDVDLGRGESYRESDSFGHGAEAVLAATPWGALGLSVCYDLRFAHLYRQLAQAGASYLTVPAAFMKTTGQAHWHVLLRARAIETGCYVFAPCQSGRHGRAVTFGHSLIVDPWGKVIADGGANGTGFIVADIEPQRVQQARRMIPALTHDRPFDIKRFPASTGARKAG